ncbi:ATP-binding cassette domain-containing protein [Nocardia otitidiscaviarum]|uniref:ATP-binding cassette domain-containing protein n=1 Tax=Nocardia otitidiscaviarum TaxID=1823 RepID=A0A516NQS9_9NOCA|nr:ATP-binding cassette domain-containing protein [Nocardia otitidiscaviarum]MCP9620358.1 ATP-binding cassette domain-containing protein [Nocardia otitidiscaviarum]QDP81265.1 ATP-binding cassette domain-containing protein [Nocardia otitidiscaviarum]
MIEARGLGKRYGEMVAVDDLSFDVRPGVVTGFLGPNGAGKSTTMRLMLGLDRGSGRTTFDGYAYPELRDPVRSVGVLLDAGAVHPARRARAHLRMVARGAGLSGRRVDEVLDLVGLTAAADRRAGGFSLGMRQRLGLAVALLGDPGTLILDEPANGLDPDGGRWLRELLRRLAAEGRTILVSSHLLNEMTLLADELVVIGAGTLIAAEPLPAFVERHCAPRVVAHTDRPRELAEALATAGYSGVRIGPEGAVIVDGQDRQGIAALALRAGVLLTGLSQEQSSLEQAYFQATSATARFRGRAA